MGHTNGITWEVLVNTLVNPTHSRNEWSEIRTWAFKMQTVFWNIHQINNNTEIRAFFCPHQYQTQTCDLGLLKPFSSCIGNFTPSIVLPYVIQRVAFLSGWNVPQEMPFPRSLERSSVLTSSVSLSLLFTARLGDTSDLQSFIENLDRELAGINTVWCLVTFEADVILKLKMQPSKEKDLYRTSKGSARRFTFRTF